MRLIQTITFKTVAIYQETMKFMHYVEITAMVTESQHDIDADVICSAIQEEIEQYIVTNLNIPKDQFKKRGITSKLEIIKAEAEYTKPMHKTIIRIEKQPHKIIQSIKKNLNLDDQKNLISTLDTRLDSKSNFFMRFNLEEFIDRHKLLLTDKGDCIHVKAKLAAYPSTKENATKILRQVLGL